ncbi:MAG: FAD-dependent oxidoreductase [Planctomycetes bacterium]|nr:FAD-dependent oxidoreductase [Planctomycetota bacterium]
MNNPRTYVVVGGVAGGASCAARLRRLDEHAEIVVLERGPYVSFANCGLPYYIGGVIQDESALLVATAELFVSRYRIDVRPENEVVAIDRAARRVRVRRRDGGEYELGYDALVLSPGARPIRPDLPGIDRPGIFSIRTVPDSRAVRAWIEQLPVRDAVVIGGGFIGLEMAENLHRRGLRVHLLELSPQLMPPFDPDMAAHMHERLLESGVAVRVGEAAAAFDEEGGRLAVRTSAGHTLACDLVILAIGVQPESQLAGGAGLALGPRGHIRVDASMRTADPRIWAIGDAVEVVDQVRQVPTAVPLAGPANRQGRIAADSIVGRDTRFRGVQGTAVCGAFGLTMACTGANQRSLRQAGIDFVAVETHPNDHVTYYPGARRFHLKLLYAPADGRILGAQAVGEGDVARRIDVIAMAMQLGGTVEDLEEAELCYAPQFGAAKDPVNMAGMVAGNVRRGDLQLASGWPGLGGNPGPHPEALCIDVREADEFAANPLPGARNVPLSQLRARLDEIPEGVPVLVTCGVGQRAYNACRCLVQHGRDARLLTGGFRSFAAHALAERFREPPEC